MFKQKELSLCNCSPYKTNLSSYFFIFSTTFFSLWRTTYTHDTLLDKIRLVNNYHGTFFGLLSLKIIFGVRL